MKTLATLATIWLAATACDGFTAFPPRNHQVDLRQTFSTKQPPNVLHHNTAVDKSSTTRLWAQDLDVVALVAGQENYGLAIVAFGEGLYSFLQAPNLQNIKVLVPPVVAALLLVAVSGPMITSGDPASAGMGLWIATAVSLALGASYILRLLAPPYDTLVPKEIAALGLVVAVAGFFSFSQNLLVDGFVTLPSIPIPEILPMPPSDNFGF